MNAIIRFYIQDRLTPKVKVRKSPSDETKYRMKDDLKQPIAP